MTNFLIRVLLVLMIPVLLIAHVGYGIYLGILSAVDEFKIGWKCPTGTKFGKSSWDR